MPRPLPLVVSLAFPFSALVAAVPAAAAPSPAKTAAHLAAARPTLPQARQQQLAAIESALATSALDPASIDAVARRVVGAVPAAKLASFELIALSDLVVQREADVRAKSRALADALDKRGALLTQVTAAQQAGQSTSALLSQLDAASDLSDADSMALQMLMTNYSTLLQAISNILKTDQDAESAIVGNIKQ
jgi:hypothetical protein